MTAAGCLGFCQFVSSQENPPEPESAAAEEPHVQADVGDANNADGDANLDANMADADPDADSDADTDANADADANSAEADADADAQFEDETKEEEEQEIVEENAGPSPPKRATVANSSTPRSSSQTTAMR